MSWFKRRRTGPPLLIYATRVEVDAAEARLAAAGLETRFRSHYQGKAKYFVFRGNDTEKAKQWLLGESVTERLCYYVVETPDGNWGKDIDGLYLEQLRPWQFDTTATEYSGDITAVPNDGAVSSAARGKIDNFVAEVACGKCSFAWYDGLRYQNLTAVRCPACQALNRVDSGNIIYSPMSNSKTKQAKTDTGTADA